MKAVIPVLWLLNTALLLACSDEPPATPEVDADVDGDGDGDIVVAPPELTPCPDDWREVSAEEEGGVATCDPWPGSDPVTPQFQGGCPGGWREVSDLDSGLSCRPVEQARPTLEAPAPAEEAVDLPEPHPLSLFDVSPEMVSEVSTQLSDRHAGAVEISELIGVRIGTSTRVSSMRKRPC